MKIERSERVKQRPRVVDYYIPRCRVRLTYYYYGKNRQLWACWKHKGKKSSWSLLRPTIKFGNDAAMLMFEVYLAELFKAYRSPKHFYRPGSYTHGQFVWRDILDRYLGVDLSIKALVLSWRAVADLVEEMRAHGKYPGKDTDQ